MYTKAVDRAKMTELVVTVKSFEDAARRYFLEHGPCSSIISGEAFVNALDISFSGGEWVNNTYRKNNLDYSFICGTGYVYMGVESPLNAEDDAGFFCSYTYPSVEEMEKDSFFSRSTAAGTSLRYTENCSLKVADYCKILEAQGFAKELK